MTKTEDNSNALRWAIKTDTANGYVVSTIERNDELKQIDGLISFFTAITVGDIGRADLSTEGDFETMVFSKQGWDARELRELEHARHATQEEAEAGHAEMVAKWENMPPGL